MTQRPIVPLVLAVALFGAIIYIMRLNAEVASLRQGTSRRPAETARQPVSSAPRTFTDAQYQSMLSTLRGEEGPVRKVWFVVDQTKTEPAALVKSLEGVFREAGWEVETKGAGGLTFKPGVSLLVGDEEWPSYASTAYDALQKAGIDVKAARGYRPYYEEQKRERPGWQGPQLAADQTYVVIVGPNPG
jgi:hypothetical protein